MSPSHCEQERKVCCVMLWCWIKAKMQVTKATSYPMSYKRRCVLYNQVVQHARSPS
jgi:hypothetical protein